MNLHRKVVLHYFNFKQPVYDIKYSPNGRSVYAPNVDFQFKWTATHRYLSSLASLTSSGGAYHTDSVGDSHSLYIVQTLNLRAVATAHAAAHHCLLRLLVCLITYIHTCIK